MRAKGQQGGAKSRPEERDSSVPQERNPGTTATGRPYTSGQASLQEHSWHAASRPGVQGLWIRP